MELVKMEARTLCDNGACGKIARVAVAREGTPLHMRLHLCEDCMRELHKLLQEYFKNEKKEK
ncbi:MAG: hypothetical protein PHI19_05535 [Clostridia bacterium]|nr:hypothetical protein [Clostridia bacterium]